MGANIMCVTSAGGLPLFVRHKGNIQPLSFSVVASLNGVHMFGKSHEAILKSTCSENSTVVWKEFEDSVVLIAVGVLNEERILEDLLTAVFNAMVLCVGIEEIKSIKNVERLKRELRPIYPVVDKCLECIDFGDRYLGTSDIFNHVETILCSENHLLQSCLESFVECVSSLFGCLMIDSCITVATECWWELAASERKLLSFVLSTNMNCSLIDIPVFLPCKSPNVPFRLVALCLLGNVWVCALCGPTPDISTIEQVSFQCWSPVADVLKSASQTFPRNVPTNLQIHNSVLGLLFIDINLGKYVSGRCSAVNKKDARSTSEVLKTFFYQAAYQLSKEGPPKLTETYWCTEYHKLHALKQGKNLLCIMYHGSIPTHAARSITQQTMSILTLDPQLCW